MSDTILTDKTLMSSKDENENENENENQGETMSQNEKHEIIKGKNDILGWQLTNQNHLKSK